MRPRKITEYRGFILASAAEKDFFAVPPEDFPVSWRNNLRASTCGELKWHIRQLLESYKRQGCPKEEKPKRDGSYILIRARKTGFVPVFSSFGQAKIFANILALNGEYALLAPIKVESNVEILRDDYLNMRKELYA